MFNQRHLLLGAVLFSATAAQAQMVVDRELLQRGISKGSIRAPAVISQQPTSPILNGPHKAVSFVAESVGPRIYSKNIPHVVEFVTPVELPDDAPITQVAWKYSLREHPQGISVKLCWQGQLLCTDITRNEIGRTTIFNGKYAGSEFNIQYVVNGTGLLGPMISGGANQIIVTYAAALSAEDQLDIE